MESRVASSDQGVPDTGQYGEMATHIALLRGINVGGNNRVAMADLRRIVASLGHTSVATYIQSGNVVFTSDGADTSSLARELEHAVAGALGVRPRVLVLSRDELAGVVRDNPYTSEPDPKRVHAVFLGDDLSEEAKMAVADAQRRAAERGSRDEAAIVGRALFLHTPDGFGRSELAATLLGRARGPAAAGTARNWATVTRLLAMCGGQPAGSPDTPV